MEVRDRNIMVDIKIIYHVLRECMIINLALIRVKRMKGSCLQLIVV